MKLLFNIANGLMLFSAMFFAFNFYRLKGKEINFKKLTVCISILSVTVLVTSLQFIFPEIVTALDRNKAALLSGEVWRLITPLFIQPEGLIQCLFNGILFVSFLPIAEYLFGPGLIVIYFVTGFVGQIANYYWEQGRGGSSTAIYGVIGSLFAYLLLNRKLFPPGYIFLSITGLLGAITLCFFHERHAPSLLVGGVISLGFMRNESDSKKLVGGTSYTK